MKYQHFFNFSFDNSIYDPLRNHFIGLFIKFFVTCLNPIKFNITDNKIIIEDLEFKPFKNDPNANELLSTLYTTPQSDLIYKNEIIKTCKFENNILQKIILLDYFLKISTQNKKRSYFEPKSTINKIKIKNYLDLKELFNCKIILNDNNKNIYYYINRLYLYLLENDKENTNNDFSIDKARDFVEILEFYQQLTKNEKLLKDIEIIKNINALNYMIFYGENFNLHFGQFVNKNINNFYNDISSVSYIENKDKNKNYDKFYKATLDECQIFYDLFITQIIVSENRMQLAACAIGLYISIYIINLLSELSTKNPHNNKLLKIIKKNKVKLYRLFIKTKGFYGKYDFLLTLLFLIFSNQQVSQLNKSNKEYQIYLHLFIQKLEKENILPPLITILMYNHKLSLDFKIIKKYIEKNNKINKNINLDNNKTVILFNKGINNKNNFNKTFIGEKDNYINYEPIKELFIYDIERNKHNHEYNIMDGINNNYNCENQNCNEILSFTIQQNIEGELMLEYVNNPRYIIIKILKTILYNNSLFIHSYNDYNDISQIAMLDELYFKIGFFKISEDNN